MYKSEDMKKIFLSLGGGLSENPETQFSLMHFYGNLCHVCHQHNRETCLKICSGCKMISYCGKEHQKQDWPVHKDFCKIISNQLKISKSSNIFDALTLKSKSDAASVLLNEKKDRVAGFIVSTMKRLVYPYEVEMIFFPRHCEICDITDSNLLFHCPNCPHANFCNNHKNKNVLLKHQKVCRLYTLCVYTNAFHIMSFFIKNVNENFKIKLFDESVNHFPRSLEEFIDSHCLLTNSNGLRENLILKNIYSEYLTYSMTLCNVLKNIKCPLNSDIEIHVIVQHFDDLRHLYLELILHWMPHINKLKIIFFVSRIVNNTVFRVPLCQSCVKNKKKLIFAFCGSRYGDYIKSDQFIKPAIVVGFELEGEVLKEFAVVVPNLKNIHCSFFITASSETSGFDCLKMLRQFIEENDLLLERNVFSSSKYYRSSYQRSGISASNMFIIYEKRRENDAENNSVSVKPQLSIQVVDFAKFIEENFLVKGKSEIVFENEISKRLRSDCRQEIENETNFGKMKREIKKMFALSAMSKKDIHLILGMWGPDIKCELLKYIIQDCFYPNVCAFCFKQHEQTDFNLWVTCESCKIVSYCSENHLTKHRDVHKDFDRVLFDILSASSRDVDYFYELMNISNEPTQRPLILMSFIDEMSDRLMESRGLYKAEEEMLKFLPHCEACSEFNPNKLIKCPECLANFCTIHRNDSEVIARHKEFCSCYMQSFILEAYNLAFDDVDLLALIIQSTSLQEQKSPFPKCIYEFLETQIDFYRLFEQLEHPDHHQMSTDFKLEDNISDLRAFVSEYLTKPLSLIYAIKKLEIVPPEETTIHVIGSTAEEIKNLNQWEFLSQWFPDLKKLTIVFVGKELSICANNSNTSLNTELSEISDQVEETTITYASHGHQLHFQFVSSLYKNYYENSNNFREPNFIIAYNPGLSVYNQWDQSLLVLTNFSCPFIFTSYYKEDAMLDHDKMKKVLGDEINYNLFLNNPYKSLRPLRFYGNFHPFVYKNNFITIYKSCVIEERHSLLKVSTHQ